MIAKGMHIPKIIARLLVVGSGMGSGVGKGGTLPPLGETLPLAICIPAMELPLANVFCR